MRELFQKFPQEKKFPQKILYPNRLPTAVIRGEDEAKDLCRLGAVDSEGGGIFGAGVEIVYECLVLVAIAGLTVKFGCGFLLEDHLAVLENRVRKNGDVLTGGELQRDLDG